MASKPDARAATDADTLEGRGRPDREQVEPPALRPLQLPAPIAEQPPGPARRRSFKPGRRALFGAALLLIVGAAGDFGYRWWTVGRFIESTDDAYVSAHNTTLAARSRAMCRLSRLRTIRAFAPAT